LQVGRGGGAVNANTELAGADRFERLFGAGFEAVR
jgi:hypothetical protein